MKTSLPLHNFTLGHVVQALALTLVGSLPLWSAAAHAADATDKNRPLRLENPEERAMLADRISEAIAKVKSEYTPPKPRRGKKPTVTPPIPVVSVEIPPAKPAPKGKSKHHAKSAQAKAATGAGTATADIDTFADLIPATATEDIDVFPDPDAEVNANENAEMTGAGAEDDALLLAPEPEPEPKPASASAPVIEKPAAAVAPAAAAAPPEPKAAPAPAVVPIQAVVVPQPSPKAASPAILPAAVPALAPAPAAVAPPVIKPLAPKPSASHSDAAKQAAVLAASLPPPPEPDPGQIRWSYEGAMGPQNWGRLHSSFSLCEQGLHQSPLHITAANTVTSPAEPLQPGAQPFSGVVVHNGRGIEVKVDGINTLMLRGTQWQLVRLQFHHPAEEKIHYQTIHPMSTDLLYQSVTGQLMVVSVPMQLGGENPFLAKIWPHLPTEYGDRAYLPAGQLQLHQLLPPDVRYYQYLGSLTAPPCTEGVLRIVLKNPASVSPEQLQLLMRAAPANARPPQPTEGRVVREAK